MTFPGADNVFDQDEVWRDADGFPWPISHMPAETAFEILSGLRETAYVHVIRYTVHMRNRANIARLFGADVPNEWEPDSAPFYDRIFEAELTGHEVMATREAAAVEWLNSKPLIRALEERARS